MFVFLLVFQADAIVLNWNPQSWTSGSLSRSFELDSSNPGVDLTITITGNTGYFIEGTPNDSTELTGGEGGSQESLWLAVNFPDDDYSVTVSVQFHYSQGVTNVNFMLFDIDRGEDSYRDLISDIYAQYDDGTPIAPTSVTGSDENSVFGSGTNRTIRGDDDVDSDDDEGNATIHYGTNILNSFTFTYGNHSSAPGNPGNQWIGLYDINFTPRPRVPEANAAWAAAVVCLGGVLLRWRQKSLSGVR